MKILKLIFDKSVDNYLSPNDIKNIKTLLTHLNAIIDFLHSQNELSNGIFNKFKAKQQEIMRILKLNGLAVYFKRHITVKELNSLLIIIQLSNEIIEIGKEKSQFLSGKNHEIQIQHLIKEITRNHRRWV